MCGIVGIVCNESVPSMSSIHNLFTDAASRGFDGFGLYIFTPGKEPVILRKAEPYPNHLDSPRTNLFLYLCEQNLEVGSVLLAISRNAPETETITVSTRMEETMQPITKGNCALVHNGAVSHRDVLRFQDRKRTKIDSETILLSYLESGRNIKRALESISGGWSFLLHDNDRKKLIVGSSFIPLAHGYVKGLGYIVHTIESSVRNFVKAETGRSDYTRTWEDFYFDEIRPYCIIEIDLDTNLVTTKEYRHKFIHPTWEQDYTEPPKQTILVAASGGIDSTLELILAKKFWEKEHVIAVHFNYGQKSQEAEYQCIKKITQVLEVPLVTVNLWQMFSNFSSMLISDDITITTGTEPKTTSAWVPNRNGVFLSCLAAIADDLILRNKCDEVGICAGFPLITEESIYPDNSGRMIRAFQNFIRFSTLAGAHNRIKFFNPCQGLTKAEELVLYRYFKLEDLFGLTISCDRAIVENGQVKQCSKDGMPACGSGLLSWWASKKAGIKDTRHYYEVDDPDYHAYIPEYLIDDSLESLKFDPSYILCKVRKAGEEAGILFF